MFSTRSVVGRWPMHHNILFVLGLRDVKFYTIRAMFFGNQKSLQRIFRCTIWRSSMCNDRYISSGNFFYLSSCSCIEALIIAICLDIGINVWENLFDVADIFQSDSRIIRSKYSVSIGEITAKYYSSISSFPWRKDIIKKFRHRNSIVSN
jgi:hypothetical protein